MGFKNGAICTVFEVKPISEKNTKLRVSISRKNPGTDEWQAEFSGFIQVLGADMAKRAAKLKERDRIVITSVDVTNRWDAEKKVEYTDFKVFEFADPEEYFNGKKSDKPAAKKSKPAEKEEEGDLPF